MRWCYIGCGMIGRGHRCSHGQISGVICWCLTLALCPALPGLDTVIPPPTLHTFGNLRHSKSMLATLLMPNCKHKMQQPLLCAFKGAAARFLLQVSGAGAVFQQGPYECSCMHPCPCTHLDTEQCMFMQGRPPPVLPARHALSRRHHLHGPRRRPAHKMRPVDPQCHDACYADLRGTHSQQRCLLQDRRSSSTILHGCTVPIYLREASQCKLGPWHTLLRPGAQHKEPCWQSLGQRKAHLEHQDADCEGAANAGLEAVLAGHALRAQDEVDDGQEHLHRRCLHAHSKLSVQRAMAKWTHLHDSSQHALSICSTEDWLDEE